MLVLTRKQNEKIRIGDEITITVLRTKGKGVRLGIEAPAHVNVLRGELVFELPAEQLEPETAETKNASETARGGTAKRAGHRQPATAHWPTPRANRPDSAPHGTARKLAKAGSGDPAHLL